MAMKDVNVLFIILVCLFSFQVCFSRRCKLYEVCQVRKYCRKLDVDHASVCYKQFSSTSWRATVKCHEGFHLSKQLPIICHNNGSFIWSVDIGRIRCVSDILPVHENPPEENNSLGIYITVPIVIVLLVAVVSLVIVRVLRKRKLSRSRWHQNKIRTVTNQSYESAPDAIDDFIDGNALYVEIAEPDMNPDGPEESEYSTLYMDTHRNNKNNNETYHHILVQSGKSKCSNIQLETDTETYSHLQDTNIDKYIPGWNISDNDTDNVYNKLQFGAGSRMKELGSTSEDPDYDLTGARSNVFPDVELDTYAHVNTTVNAVVDKGTKC